MTGMDESSSILLIDDDEDYKVLIDDLLHEAGLPRHRLDWEASYARGIKRLLAGEHAVCLLDYRLGPDSGLDLLREARSRGCDTPVIVLTALGDRDVDLEAMRAGASDFLVKGRIDGRTLERAVRYALERHRTARALRESEARARELAEELQAILETLPDVILRLDAAGRILDCNAGQGPCLFAADAESLRGRRLMELLPPGAGAQLQRSLQDVSRGQRAHLDVVLPDGHAGRHLELRIAPLQEVPGAAYLVIAQDVTDRKQRDAMLIQASKLAAIGELAGNIAHEVNNPIGIVSAKARLLLSDKRQPLPERVERELTKIVEQCDRIALLTRGLLDFARPTQQGREPIDVRQPLQKALTMIAGRTQRGLIQVEERFASDAPPVLGNANELQQVFLNLLINAADAMPGGGKVVASVAHEGVRLPTGPAVQVSIADTGHGVPPEIANRIFDPFFTTKGEVKGTGLGLAICLGIVRGHGGTIGVESRPGQGATFVIKLPAAS